MIALQISNIVRATCLAACAITLTSGGAHAIEGTRHAPGYGPYQLRLVKAASLMIVPRQQRQFRYPGFFDCGYFGQKPLPCRTKPNSPPGPRSFATMVRPLQLFDPKFAR
jgi:hypothetical protein